MKKILEKLSLLTMVFSVILLFQILVGGYTIRYDNLYEQKIALDNKIENVYAPQQISFENTLKNITQYISQTDSFLGIGGASLTPEYFDSVIFEEIMKAEGTNDFDLFLSNSEYYFNERAVFFDTLPSIWPIEFSPRIRVTSGFGERFSPFTGKLQQHSGIDLVSTWGAKIISTAPGKVIEKWNPPSKRTRTSPAFKGHPVFGGYVVVDHGNGYRTHYAHMSEIYVKEGMSIERGSVIGRMGNTGLSNGEHLHYGIEKFSKETQEWNLIDPINFLRGVK